MRRRGNHSLISKGVVDENLIYDDTNISAQFPNANNTGIDSTGNVLTATSSNGEAISIVKSQDIGQNDFTALTSDIVPFKAKFEFANISDVTSTDDTLITATPIQDGDNLVIIKDDEGINEIEASQVISPVDPIPVMTSNTTPAGIVFFSEEDGGAFTSAYQAFDKGANPFGRWLTNSTSGFLGYEFDFTVNIKSYAIYNKMSGLRSPKNWTFQGGDGVSWVELDTQVGVNFGDNDYKHFVIQNNTSQYIKYRINVTENGGDANFLQIYELYMFETTFDTYQLDTTPTTQGEIPSRVYSVDADFSAELSGGFVSAEKDSDSYVYESLSDIIPIMTSNTTPSGVVFASSDRLIVGSTAAWYAFDKGTIPTARWLTQVGVTTGHIGYVFPLAQKIKSYSLRLGEGSVDRDAKNWTFEGSDDGIIWTVLDTIVNETYTSPITVNYPINNPSSFTHYRLNVSANNGSTGALHLYEITMFAEIFKTTRTYKNLIDPVGSQTLQSKVTLKASGDKMTELTATINKKT